MTNKVSTTARLLFVIDNDHGALGIVMYLLYGQALATQTTLLLPRRAYELHKNQLSITCRPYGSIQDILDCVENQSPDMVCLSSGYEYASQGLFTIPELQKLIRLLLRRGCKLATTDPYLGTFRQIAVTPARTGAMRQNLKRQLQKYPALYKLGARLARNCKKKILQRHVRRVADSLENVIHICAVPTDRLPSDAASYLSFFNPLYIRSPEDLRDIAARVSTFPDINPRRQRWMFVLARFDLEFQLQKYGQQAFIDIVVNKLRQALDNGKHPVLISPAAFVTEVSRHFTPDSGVSLLPVCAFAEFEQRLLDAEIVFYWQIFSTSTFLRLLNGLPVFFFDRGHTAHLIKPLHEAGLKSYYIADPPIYLDIEKPLDAAELAAQCIRFQHSAQESCEYLAESPTPAKLIETIMGSA